MIAKSDKHGCGARRREDVSKHLSAAAVNDLEVADLRALTLGDVVLSKGDVFGTLPETSLLGKGDSGFAVFVDDRGRVLVKAQFDAEFAKENAFLSCGAEANDLGFGGVENLKRRLGGAPGDGATIDQEDVADGRETCCRDVGEGSIGVADDSAGL